MDRKINKAAAIKAKQCALARLHFRAAVRLVYQNHYWLEDTEGEKLGLNVAKNIQIITRKKPKGQFTLTEKAIMKVPQEKRTEAEKQILRRKLGVMKCFRKYPPEVKNELASITYFEEYETDRTIVRQGDDALGLYFVVSGTARVLVKQYDPVIDQVTEITVKVKEEGDIFGELALLVGSERTATIITNERSEFLTVKRQDFDRVLKSTVQKEWDEIKTSIRMFDYFNKWSERHVLQSCMVSKMRYYDEQTLILSEDQGDKRYVYFVVDGSVDLLECLEMKVTTYKNNVMYTLHNSFDMGSASGMKSFTDELEKLLKERLAEGTSLSDLKLSTLESKLLSMESLEFQSRLSKSLLKLSNSLWKTPKKNAIKYNKASQKLAFNEALSKMSQAERVSFVKKFESKLSRVTSTKEVPVSRIETYFIRVAKMAPLSTFNVGEHLDSRFYVSRSKVKLLVIPRYWLMSRDKPVWNNILILLKTLLPNRMQLYEQFVKNRSWMEYRRECFYDIAGRTKKSNINCINNVPLSIRLKGDLAYFVCSKPYSSKRSSVNSGKDKTGNRVSTK